MPDSLIDKENPVTGELITGNWHLDDNSMHWQNLSPSTAHNATSKGGVPI